MSLFFIWRQRNSPYGCLSVFLLDYKREWSFVLLATAWQRGKNIAFEVRKTTITNLEPDSIIYELCGKLICLSASQFYPPWKGFLQCLHQTIIVRIKLYNLLKSLISTRCVADIWLMLLSLLLPLLVDIIIPCTVLTQLTWNVALKVVLSKCLSLSFQPYLN